jgi:uncharacterized protein
MPKQRTDAQHSSEEHMAAEVQTNTEILISADSHVSEATDFWVERLPARYRDVAPRFAERPVGSGFQAHPGGWDANERVKEMAQDGVSAEVLYPTAALSLFSLSDAELQEACFRVYNDWLVEYCSVAPDRLVGIACISAYNIDHAIEELMRCRKEGLRGALVWQAPPAELALKNERYEPLWAAAQDLEMPINVHILTGPAHALGLIPPGVAAAPPAPVGPPPRRSPEGTRNSVNLKLMEAANVLYDFIFYGILERYPRLKLVLVENEIGWIPWLLQQWDYYFHRFRSNNPDLLKMEPSAYFYRQVYATFFNDAVGGHHFPWFGVDNCMWSNDCPHGNSTWPNSRQVIERDLGHLSAEDRQKLVCGNVTQLYNLKVPAAV